jgi:Rel/ankyrin family protein
LPRQKKPGFFSKLFSRRKSKIDLNESTHSLNKAVETEPQPEVMETVIDPVPESAPISRGPVKLIVDNTKLLEDELRGHRPLGRSASSVSGKRPHSGDNPDVIYIPLKGDSMSSLPTRGSTSNLPVKTSPSLHRGGSQASLRPIDHKTMSALQLAALPLTDGNRELVAIADAQSIKNLCQGDFGIKLDPNVDLTEAEHFALYTSIAPCATESEFDETSCYYGQVDPSDPFLQDDSAKKIKLIN